MLQDANDADPLALRAVEPQKRRPAEGDANGRAFGGDGCALGDHSTRGAEEPMTKAHSKPRQKALQARAIPERRTAPKGRSPGQDPPGSDPVDGFISGHHSASVGRVILAVMANQGNPDQNDNTDREEPKLTKSGAIQHSVTEDTLVIKGSVRRRCSAMTVRGTHCKAFALHSGDLCRVHQEIQDTGEIKFGSLTLQEAGAKSGRVRQAQVHLRQTLLPNGRITPRTALRALALRDAGSLAQRALDGALEGEASPAKGSLALRVIEIADPVVTAEVSFDAPQSLDDLTGLPDEAKKKWLLAGLE